jgi:c(7)-type cytochrome triheme protein
VRSSGRAPGLKVALARGVVLVAAAGGLAGCGEALRIFLDLPAPVREEEAQELPPGLALAPDGSWILIGPQAPPPPEIESVADPSAVLARLPVATAGVVDWDRAVREEIIRPREWPDSGAVPGDTADSPDFPYDFFMGNSGSNPGSFPHSVHSYWASCASCHPAPYGRQRGETDLETVHGTASCGRCHGPVAFPVTACEGCHAGADLPARRIEPGLGQDLVLVRGEASLEDHSQGGEESRTAIGFAASDPGRQSYAPARFSHWRHRIRYRCSACHVGLFPMSVEPLGLSQQEAHGVRACGLCHNGKEAFGAGLGECGQCHRAPDPGDG